MSKVQWKANAKEARDKVVRTCFTQQSSAEKCTPHDNMI